MNRQAEHDIRRETRVLAHAEQSGNISHGCRKYGASRETYPFNEYDSSGLSA